MSRDSLNLDDLLDEELTASPTRARGLHHAIDEEIGESLRYARKLAGLTQVDVAEIMGITRSRVSQIEGTRGSSLSLDVLGRFANAVGCRVDLTLRERMSDEVRARIVLLTALHENSTYTSTVPNPEEVETNQVTYFAHSVLQHIHFDAHTVRHETHGSLGKARKPKLEPATGFAYTGFAHYVGGVGKDGRVRHCA